MWGLQIELVEKFETVSALSQLSSASSTAQTRSAASSTQSESLMLVLSSSEELDILSIEVFNIGDSPAISLQYEELMEGVPQSVSKLNIDWLAKKQEAQRKSTLNEHFLQSQPQLPRRGLPLFPDLHTKVSRLWKKPFSSRLTSPMVHHYSSIVGLKDNGYGTMPRDLDAWMLLKSCVGPLIYLPFHGSYGGHGETPMAEPLRLSPPGLFGNTVSTVDERFQEAKKQKGAFQKFIPHSSEVQSQTSAPSFSYR